MASQWTDGLSRTPAKLLSIEQNKNIIKLKFQVGFLDRAPGDQAAEPRHNSRRHPFMTMTNAAAPRRAKPSAAGVCPAARPRPAKIDAVGRGAGGDPARPKTTANASMSPAAAIASSPTSPPARSRDRSRNVGQARLAGTGRDESPVTLLPPPDSLWPPAPRPGGSRRCR
jgi:hypothetical protein